ncbi:MAG TPA: ABC transporter permease, partial [Methanocella sp.]|nr:ABC transporter permease [Methanocella sp.]
LQSTVILAMALLLGVKMPGVPELAAVYLALAAFGVLVSAAATTAGLLVADHDSYSAINTLISMPLFFASSALMPYDQMPAWLRAVASLNPVSYAIDATRSLFAGAADLTGIAALALLGLIVVAISVYVFRKATV